MLLNNFQKSLPFADGCCGCCGCCGCGGAGSPLSTPGFQLSHAGAGKLANDGAAGFALIGSNGFAACTVGITGGAVIGYAYWKLAPVCHGSFGVQPPPAENCNKKVYLCSLRISFIISCC